MSASQQHHEDQEDQIRDEDIVEVHDDDGQDGHADGPLRRRDGAPERAGSYVVDSRPSLVDPTSPRSTAVRGDSCPHLARP